MIRPHPITTVFDKITVFSISAFCITQQWGKIVVFLREEWSMQQGREKPEPCVQDPCCGEKTTDSMKKQPWTVDKSAFAASSGEETSRRTLSHVGSVPIPVAGSAKGYFDCRWR